MLRRWSTNFQVRALFLALLVAVPACRDADPVQQIDVSMKNTDVYTYRIALGDEDGSRIVVQPKHYAVSEMRRGPGTQFAGEYRYQPAPGFVGSDLAELEVSTGSDAASAPTRVQRIVLRFTVTN